jgi:hypothetical protein
MMDWGASRQARRNASTWSRFLGRVVFLGSMNRYAVDRGSPEKADVPRPDVPSGHTTTLASAVRALMTSNVLFEAGGVSGTSAEDLGFAL